MIRIIFNFLWNPTSENAACLIIWAASRLDNKGLMEMAEYLSECLKLEQRTCKHLVAEPVREGYRVYRCTVCYAVLPIEVGDGE